MLDKTIVTQQAGSIEKQINRRYIEDGGDIERKIYISMIVDHETGKLANAWEFTGGARSKSKKLFGALYEAFTGKDISLLEINSLIVTKAGNLHVFRAKVSFDGNVLFRHPNIMSLRDQYEEDTKVL